MKRTARVNLFLLFVLSFNSLPLKAQIQYFPDSVWQTHTPSEMKLKSEMIDSAVQFALSNDSKTDYDLRIADIKAYAGEPNYKILGPTKPRGKPAGMILKNGFIVAQWEMEKHATRFGSVGEFC